MAIVGSSGSGKSTVVSLMERFYEPNTGCILLDGHNIKSLQVKWLRMQLGLVCQEPSLFATTILENILIGKENATEEEAKTAAKFSHAHTFIEKFPDGYNTQVGQKGIQLSGGQKQRIAIARAVLKDPSILLLDEATSALDSSSEKLVQDALDYFISARTSIVIAHRLSTIRHVDTIAVVDMGKLVETGTHDELMSKQGSGAYYRLVKLQGMGINMSEEHRPTLTDSPKSTLPFVLSSASRRRESPSFVSPAYISPVHVSSAMGTLALSENSAEVSYKSADFEADNEVSITEKTEGKMKSTNLSRLLKLSAPEWPQALLGSFACVLTGVVNPLAALLLASVAIVYYYPDHDYMQKKVCLYAACFVVLAAVGLIGYVIQDYFWGYVTENLTVRVRQKMLSAILRNEAAWFDKDENSSGQLSLHLYLDAAAIGTVVGGRLSLILHNFTLLVVSIVMALVLSWKMGLVTLSVFPLAVVAAFAENTFLKGYGGDMEQAHRKASTIAGDAVANIRTVVALCAQEKMVSFYQQQLINSKQQSLVRGAVAGCAFGVAQFLQFSARALALWYGMFLVRHGADPWDTVKVFFVLMVGAIVVGGAIGNVPDLAKGGSALRSVFEILDRKTNIDPDEDLPCVNAVKGEVELRMVGFSYPTRPDVPIFKDLNIRADAGTSLALVGKSGCGKSTVVALIERFYDPTEGKVMVDGMDIRAYNLKSLRHHIGLVQQEPALFASSIYDNILYGNAHASEGEVEAAAKAANAHGFISGLPDGYQTFVGERGVQLSGGQKQRVAIARAVLKGPAILLLDEATSALDAESETVVQVALERLMQGRTVILIAHRLSTIQNVDTIAVIQDGSVVERGSPASLLASPLGAYSQLIKLQRHLGAAAYSRPIADSCAHLSSPIPIRK